MGAWGTRPLDNDGAADWAGELTKAAPEERSRLLRRTLQAVLLDGDRGVELDESSQEEWGAEEAIAAAAVRVK